VEPPQPSAPQAWTVLAILQRTTDFFRSRDIESPRLAAELLLSKVLDCERIQLYASYDRPLEPAEVDAYRELVRKRSQRCPVHYLLGEREFFSRSFLVSPDVLIPRPETELVVEMALSIARSGDGGSPALTFADIGTGSGNIAVTIACELAEAQVHASDISAAALSVAEANADRHAVRERVDFHCGDLFSALPEDSRRQFGFVLSNPPYVPEAEIDKLMPEVRDHEPRTALAVAGDGLDFFRRLVDEAPQWLCPRGHLLLELGIGQAKAVRALVEASPALYLNDVLEDYAGIERVLHASTGE